MSELQLFYQPSYRRGGSADRRRALTEFQTNFHFTDFRHDARMTIKMIKSYRTARYIDADAEHAAMRFQGRSSQCQLARSRAISRAIEMSVADERSGKARRRHASLYDTYRRVVSSPHLDGRHRHDDDYMHMRT